MSRVLVVGAAGYLGGFLTRRLLLDGMDVHIMIRKTTDLSRIHDVLKDVTVNHIEQGPLQAKIATISPNFIINLLRHGPSNDENQMIESNIKMTTELLNASANLDLTCFIHTGSSLEYGPKATRIHESDLPEPTTFFGATKISATKLCQQYASETGKNVVILRPFLVYGPNDKSTRFIPTAIESVINHRPLSITPDKYKRDWVFIDDVIDAYMAVLYSKRDWTGEIINIASGVQYSAIEIVTMIQKIVGQKNIIEKDGFAPRSFDTTSWVADISKAKRILDWAPKNTLYQGLQKTIKISSNES